MSWLLLVIVFLCLWLIHREADAGHPGRVALALIIQIAAFVALVVSWF